MKAFADPAEALVWLTENAADLIVTDYEMPKIDGGEFISRFRALPQGQSVPVMMLTAHEQRLLRLRALESGANDFLTTPIDHNEFLMRARNLLKLGKARAGEAAPAPPDAAEKLLAGCGEQGYALHALRLGRATDEKFWRDALARHLRQGDSFAPLGEDKCLILQAEAAQEAEARAFAGRLRLLLDGPAGFRIGSALSDLALPPTERAVACRRAAEAALERDSSGKSSAKSSVQSTATPAAKSAAALRFLPRVDLRAGAVVGAQAMWDDAPAPAEAALDLAPLFNRLRAAGAAFRLSFVSRLGDERQDAAVLRLASAGAPGQVELRFSAAEALALGRPAEERFAALRQTGLRIALELDAAQLAASPPEPGLLALLSSCADLALAAGAEALLEAGWLQKLGPTPLLVAGVAAAGDLPGLRRAGAVLARGACFGAPLRGEDLARLFDRPRGARSLRAGAA